MIYRKTKWKEGIEWVIFSPRKNSIWGGGARLSYLTEQDANNELEKQMNMLTPEIRQEVDWRVESRNWRTNIYVDSVKENTDTDDNWGGF